METLALYMGTGAAAGILAGLFGIGGGAVVVPLLVFIFGLTQAYPEALVVHVAVASSLVTVSITSASSAVHHWRRGTVELAGFAMLAPGLVLGAMLGPTLAGRLSGEALSSAIGGFILLTAVQVGLDLRPKEKMQLGMMSMVTAGGGIGVVSALFGIGGGTLLVPWLNWAGRQLHVAVGTSSLCALVVGLSGSAAYALAGAPLQADWSTGYIYWPAVAGIVLGSVPCTALGVALAHRLGENHLRLAFSSYLVLVGFFLILRNWTPL